MPQVIAVPDVIQVGIVDEYPAQANGVAQALERAEGMGVGFVAGSGQAARHLIEADPPDVLIIEPWMRSGDGIELIEWVSVEYPEMAVIALSRLWDASHVEQAAAAGARAHLQKDTRPDDLPSIIRHVRAGAVMRPSGGEAVPGRAPLTARERDVLRLLASGLKNAQIARELFVTEQTVKFHVRNIFRKLGVETRTQAAYQAARLGITG